MHPVQKTYAHICVNLYCQKLRVLDYIFPQYYTLHVIIFMRVSESQEMGTLAHTGQKSELNIKWPFNVTRLRFSGEPMTDTYYRITI